MASTREKIARHGWRAIEFAAAVMLAAAVGAFLITTQAPRSLGGIPVLLGIGISIGVGIGLLFKGIDAAANYFHLRGAARRRADKGLPIP